MTKLFTSVGCNRSRVSARLANGLSGHYPFGNCLRIPPAYETNPLKPTRRRIPRLNSCNVFVVKDSTKTSHAFNYNNVDYILLTRILATITKKPSEHCPSLVSYFCNRTFCFLLLASFLMRISASAAPLCKSSEISR